MMMMGSHSHDVSDEMRNSFTNLGQDKVDWNDEAQMRRSTHPVPPAKRMKVETSPAMLSEDGWQTGVMINDFTTMPEGAMTVPTSAPKFGSTPSIDISPSLTHGVHQLVRRPAMQTGCVSCLVKAIPCNPRNPGCRLAMSTEWSLNDASICDEDAFGISGSQSLTTFRIDTQWRRSWRERHSLNFFVNFSAPQMAGFFDSTFWQRVVIQTSYHEPAILHAVTAIGALHECIMQRALSDEKRKARALEFALGQCNRAIACLTAAQSANANPRLALIACVLFTCFEAMQGRCDSAVTHALQGRRLLMASDQPDTSVMTVSEEDNVEQMRPIVERLEVQATALLEKGRRPGSAGAELTPPLPPLDYVYSLDHAHNTLHMALNSVMRFMQGFDPAGSQEQIVNAMAEKYMRYVPWFSRWEVAFTTFLSNRTEALPDLDLKRAMVLKTNHLVGTMLASVDQSAGPAAYDAYEAEFRAIVDLAREVLSSFSCPPLPTLTGGSTGTPYLSFSLWVTDPLWMAISRCRNPSVRQAAFTLLSQNPRQEGIWHAGPPLISNRPTRRADATKGGENAGKKEKGASDSLKRRRPTASEQDGNGNNNDTRNSSPPKTSSEAEHVVTKIEQDDT